MPITNEDELEEFWYWFNEELSKWSSGNKKMFMNM